LRAAAAVRVVMLHALFLAHLAGLDAHREHAANELAVLVGPPAGDAVDHRANIGAVHAQADAPPHVHFLGAARVGAAVADRGAVHRVLDRFEQALVVVVADIGMLADHFLDRHGDLSFTSTSARGWGLFRC